MAYALVQETSAAVATSGATLAAGSITVTAGDALLIAVLMDGASVPTLSGNSNTYVSVDSTGGTLYTFYALNCNAGSTNVTASATGNIKGIYVAEYSGIVTSGALLGHNIATIIGPGGTANGASSGTATVTTSAALVWGFMFDSPGNSDGTDTAGTSPLAFTMRTKCWPQAGGGSGTKNSGYPEDARVTSNGNYGATWGCANNGFDTVFCATVILKEIFDPHQFTAQTITSSSGVIGAAVSYPQISFTDTFTLGWNVTPLIPQLGVPLTAQTASFVEGGISSQFTLSSQAITSSEGAISASVQGGATLALGPINALFVEGVPLFSVGYILDQNTLTMVGQTATFSEGALSVVPNYTLANFTITSTEGVIDVTSLITLSLSAQTITSVEGAITAQAGNAFNANLGPQTITSSEFFAVPPAGISYTPSAQTLTSTEGTITFSNTSAFTVQLGSQSAVFTEGVLALNVPQGTGPPLFIPPQLGKPVTTRTFSWSEMAQRAWGSEFRAPDHRIYQFSGGNYKDSTDLGTTGIYTNQQGPADNPPPSP